MRRLIVSVMVAVVAIVAGAENIELVVKALGETGHVTTSPAIVGNQVEKGARVTLTAEGASGRRFIRWAGKNIPEGSEELSTITITANEAGRITPIFDGMWIFTVTNAATGQGTISDTRDNYVFNFFGADADKKTFTFGLPNGGYGCALVKGTKDVYGIDLSQPYCDLDGQEWTATKIYSGGFGMLEYCTYGSIIFPRTLASDGFGGQNLNGNWNQSNGTNYVLDCPLVTGNIPAYFMTGIKHNNVNLQLRLPKVTTIKANAFSGGNYYYTRLDTWDLRGLKTIEKDWGLKGKNFGGNLKLPAIETLGAQVFNGCWNMNSIELGLNGGTLKSVGSGAFGGRCGIKKLKMAFASGCTVASDAFTLTNGLSEVYILSRNKPLVNGVESLAMFANGQPAARACAFYVPRSSEFEDVFAAARPAEESEINAFMKAHPTAQRPEYVVDGSVFGLENEQFLGVAGGVFCNLNIHMPGTVEVKVTQASGQEEVVSESGTLAMAANARVKLKAMVREGATFGFWRGVGESQKYAEEIELELGEDDVDVTLYTGENWGYHANEGIISNSVWSLRVMVLDAANKELVVGKYPEGDGEGHIGYAFTDRGEGDLSLLGDIVEENGTKWKITMFSGAAFVRWNSSLEMPIRSIVFPMTTTNIVGQILNLEGSVSRLEEIVMNLPNVEGMKSFMVGNHNNRFLKLYLHAPKIKEIPSNAFTSYIEIDMDECCLDGVTKLANLFQYASVRGVAKLPRLLETTARALGDCGVEGMELGTAYDIKEKQVLTLRDGAFAGDKKLESILMGPYADIVTEANANGVYRMCDGCVKIHDVRFEGRPPARLTLDQILQSVPVITEQEVPVIVRGSKKLNWEEIPGLRKSTPDEDLKKPVVGEHEEVLGVYETGSDLGGDVALTRNGPKAWLVHSPSKYDPKGTILIIR